MTEATIIIRILVATLLGGLIGIEREIHGCAAGLRTHILVSIGSALFMITSIGIAVHYGAQGEADPSRIAAGVVTGIGFLGAGAIIRYGVSIKGLTTAASIWAVSAVGLAVGGGMYLAGGLTAVVMLVILILSRLEERMQLKRHGKDLYVKMCYDCDIDTEDIRHIVEAYGGKIKKVSPVSENENEKEIVMALSLARIYHRELVSEIVSLGGILDVYWK